MQHDISTDEIIICVSNDSYMIFNYLDEEENNIFLIFVSMNKELTFNRYIVNRGITSDM